MRITTFNDLGGDVDVSVIGHPDRQPFEEYEGMPLDKVKLVEIARSEAAEFQLVEIEAGGAFPMHTSPQVAFCQIVRGRGKLGLPGGREIAYEGPELFIFHPGSYHDWHAIEEDTLLSVCLVSVR
jgi:quercetin dioxygenase-like cupin family protein